jgi:hypothetical protein
MNYVGRVDVLDLIIESLKEHEKKLDDIVSRLESLLKVRGEWDLHRYRTTFNSNR